MGEPAIAGGALPWAHLPPAELPPVDLVGVHGGECFGVRARQALQAADVLMGSARHLDALATDVEGERVVLAGPLEDLLADASVRRQQGQRVCLVVSGDPGFFGLARLADQCLGPTAIRVHPAPASAALAFARLCLPWDDALVVSAHGRPAGAAVESVLRHHKVAILTSPETPPQEIGSRLVELGCPPRRAAVAARLGEPDESLWEGDLEDLAGGRFDPLAVVVLTAPESTGHPAPAALRLGLPIENFAHRAGMITKPEVRAVAISKLLLPLAGVLWDVGAGSGSVSFECAQLMPGLEVLAIERNPSDLELIEANLAGVATRGRVTAILGEAPGALAGLPDPDRVFVGGGGLEVLDAVLARLKPGGVVVATYASIDRAAEAGRRLGNLVELSVSRGVPSDNGGSLRLAAENPVFVCWGPGERGST